MRLMGRIGRWLILGLIVASCLPVAAAQADSLTWGPPTVIDPPSTTNTAGLTAVSCPSASLCVAVDDSGNVVTSTNPAGGAHAWTVAHVDGSQILNGISCPTTTL